MPQLRVKEAGERAQDSDEWPPPPPPPPPNPNQAMERKIEEQATFMDNLRYAVDQVTGSSEGAPPTTVLVDRESMKKKVRDALTKPSYSVFDYYKDAEDSFFSRLAQSTQFENVTLFIIALNAIWMAHDTNVNDADSLLEADYEFVVAELFFCAYFSFEWFSRFMAFRRKLNGLRDGWFVFDSLLVFMMVGETWVIPVVMLARGREGTNVLGNTSIFRLFRLLRLSRMARMLRSFPEILILIKGMAAATKSVFFVFCLLIIIMYVFSIAFTQLADGTTMGLFYFPNVQHSMYSLLLYGTFLDNLSQFCEEVGAESPVCLALIFVFVLLAACTVLNMLIGVLCEVVSGVAAAEQEQMRVTDFTEKLQSLLTDLDKDKDGHISKAEFMKILEIPEAARALEEVGVDPVSIIDFSEFIFGNTAATATGPLSFDKFMEVILDLRTENVATIRDMVSLRTYITQQMSEMTWKMCREVPRILRHKDKESERRSLQGPEMSAPPIRREVSHQDFAEIEARTANLEEMMGLILTEVKELSNRMSPNQSSSRNAQSLPNVPMDLDELHQQLPRAHVLSPKNSKSMRTQELSKARSKERPMNGFGRR